MSKNEKEKIHSFITKNAGYICTMGILFLVLGIIISTQTKRHIIAEKSMLPVERQLNSLVVLLKETQSKKENLEKQLSKLRRQARGLSQQSTAHGLTGEQYKTLYQIAGLTPIKGEGIEIKLEDKSSNNDIKNPDLFNNDGLVHSDDLLKIVNELKGAGAKAVAINNQRLVTISEIATAGSNILVNQTKLNPPYIIKAVGPADTMISALKMRGGILEYLEVFGIKVSLEKKSEIKLPAYEKPLL